MDFAVGFVDSIGCNDVCVEGLLFDVAAASNMNIDAPVVENIFVFLLQSDCDHAYQIKKNGRINTARIIPHHFLYQGFSCAFIA